MPIASNGATTNPWGIHVVNVARATERVFSADATGVFVSDYDGSGVYFSEEQAAGHLQSVWRLDVASGSRRQLLQTKGVAFIQGGYAWLNRVDPRDPSPSIDSNGPVSNSVVRVTLSTGQESILYYAAGKRAFFRGLDRCGQLIVSVASGPDYARPAIQLASSPTGTLEVIYSGDGGLNFFGPQADTGGRLWFGNEHGIYLYTPAKGLQKVYAMAYNSVLGQAIEPAGLCL